MYNTEWTKQLNESYINNIRNPENNEIVLTEEQLNEHFTNLAIIVESIERTFDIELTEQEIDYIDEQLQLNEFLGVLAKIGFQAGKRLAGKGLQSGGKVAQAGYKTKRVAAIKKAKDATNALNKDFWAGKPGAILHDPIKADLPKKGFLTKLGQKAAITGKKWTPEFISKSGKERGLIGSSIRQAGYKSGWDATKAAAGQTLGALSVAATGAAGLSMLGKDNVPKIGKKETSGKNQTSRGEHGDLDTDWETESGYRRPTGVRT